MRHILGSCSVVVLAAVVSSACVWAPSPGVSIPSTTEVLPADARALRFGASAPEVLDNPQLRDKVRALFGPDWTAGAQRPFGAPAYFPASSSIRMVRMGGDGEYIAITGCVPTACAAQRGLLLIRPDGEQLLARLDEGGFVHYYHHSAGATGSAVPRPAIDGAWMAVERAESR